MTLSGSSSITDQRVYAQETKPTDQRDGVLWVDTSKSARPMYTYSSDTDEFEPVAPAAIHRQGTQPTDATDGDIWVETDVSPRVVRAYDADADTWNRAGKTTEKIQKTTMIHNDGFAPGFSG